MILTHWLKNEEIRKTTIMPRHIQATQKTINTAMRRHKQTTCRKNQMGILIQRKKTQKTSNTQLFHPIEKLKWWQKHLQTPMPVISHTKIRSTTWLRNNSNTPQYNNWRSRRCPITSANSPSGRDNHLIMVLAPYSFTDKNYSQFRHRQKNEHKT